LWQPTKRRRRILGVICMSKVVLFNHKTFNLEQWSIEEIIRCINSPTEKIQVMPPEFQRDFIASLKWQRDLIDSFYNGLSSNLIHFRKLDKEKASKIGFAYQCLDGLQRLSTTINFVNNKFDDNNGKCSFIHLHIVCLR
jgi:uncharacterized protein with ParB-like and HNH nuclease domain